MNSSEKKLEKEKASANMLGRFLKLLLFPSNQTEEKGEKEMEVDKLISMREKKNGRLREREGNKASKWFKDFCHLVKRMQC